MHTKDNRIDFVESPRSTLARKAERTAPRSSRGAAFAIALAISGVFVLALIVDGGMLALSLYLFHRYDNRLLLIIPQLLIPASMHMVWSFCVGKTSKLRGARFNPENQPELFEHIRRVAREMNEQPPAELILSSEARIWAMRAGGILGIGGSRVVGFGLPFIQRLTVSQFEALLALELAHLRYGQTGSLLTWIERSHMSLANSARLFPGFLGFGMPFTWYHRLFHKVATKRWRAMDHESDLLAARVVGADALIRAICEAASLTGPAPNYFITDIEVLLDWGVVPPAIEGLAAKLGSPNVIAEVDKDLGKTLGKESDAPEQYFTPLSHRMVRLQGLPQSQPFPPRDDRPLFSIIRDLPSFESELTRKVKKIQVMRWGETGTAIWMYLAKRTVKRFAPVLEGVRLSDTFRLVTTGRYAFGRRVAVIKHRTLFLPHPVNPENCGDYAVHMLGCAIASRLHASAWVPEAGPGMWCTFKRGSVEFNPFETLFEILSGRMTEKEWEAKIRECGLFPSMPLFKVESQK